jgi:hypothetical protein
MELLDTRCKSWHVFLIQPPKTSCRRRGRGPAKRVRPIAHRPGMEAERLEVELGALGRGDDGFLVTGGRRLPRLLRRRWLVAAPDGSHRLEIVTFERPKFESTETLTSFASLICVFSIGDNMRIAKWVHERELAGSRVGRRSGSGVRGTGSASMGRAPAGVVAQRT